MNLSENFEKEAKKNLPRLVMFVATWHTILLIKMGVRDCNSEVW